MRNVFEATRCDDGIWMVHSKGDIIAYAAYGDEEPKAQRVAAALNASTTFIPENRHGVKPGYHTKPDVIRLLRLHCRNPAAVHFIADMME